MRKWIKMILEGLVKAEECGVVHADLKPENIMIQENKEDFLESPLKIIDFGSSCFLNKKSPYMYI
jgi:dual specificity protein kinase YAK1